MAALRWWGPAPDSGASRFGRWLAAIDTGEGHPEDEPEISRLRRRHPGTWRVFFEREMPAIYRYARTRLARAEEAEDATSTVFEQAWAHAGRLEDHGLPARAWLFGIARHVVGGYRRRLVQGPPELAIESFDAPVVATPDAAHLDLARAIAALSRRHAEVVTLRFVHGLSLEETAAALEVTVNAVKGRQARALEELRAALEGSVRPGPTVGKAVPSGERGP
jgi:RNA polymerase sigma-70 factor (ECF subfamily)